MGVNAKGRMTAESVLDNQGRALEGPAHATSVKKQACTTAGWSVIPVPEDAKGAQVWATGSGAATGSAFVFGGAGVAPDPETNGAIVPSGITIPVHCANASALFVKATGAACDVYVLFFRKEK